MKTITLEWITYNLVPQGEVVEVKEKVVSYKRLRAEEWVYYYFLIWGKVRSTPENNIETDDWDYNTWNYYLTREEAEKARDKQLATVRVNDAIDELNEGWVADWGHENDYKYSIIYDHKEHKFLGISSFNLECLSNIKHIKSEKIYQQIIKKHKEDLKLIFNIV